jgi:hypothetical protein
MEKIVSKRHFWKFYVFVFAAFFFFLTMSVVCMLIFIKDYFKGQMPAKEYLMIIQALVTAIYAFYIVFQYYKNVPKIVISRKTILFSGKSYNLKDINKINISGKQPFPIIIVNMQKEAANIEFNDKKVLNIYDDMYSNLPAIKQFLEAAYYNTELKKSYSNQPLIKYPGGHFYYYKDSFVLSMREMLFSFMITMFALSALKTGSFSLLLLTIVIFYPIFALVVNYVGLNEKHLVIKNHLLFWKRETYTLSEIKEIVFESHYKEPNSIRVITKNYFTKKYAAATLNDSTWRKLETELLKENIIVRNEIYV